MNELIKRLTYIRASQSLVEAKTREKWLKIIQYYRNMSFFQQYSTFSNEELLDVLEVFAWMYSVGNIFPENILKAKESQLENWREEFQDYYELEEIFNKLDDWTVVESDESRVIRISFDYIYGGAFDDVDLPNTWHIKMLERLSRISRYMFLPENISINNSGLPQFTLNGEQYQIEFNGKPSLLGVDPWVTAKVINPLLLKTGYQFELWDGYPDGLLTLLTQEEKIKLQRERNWKFKPHQL